MAVESSLRSEEKSSAKRELIDINATPESDSPLRKPTFQQFLPRNRAMHHLLRVKPHMMIPVLSHGDLREEIKVASSGDAEMVELFPRRTGLAITKHSGSCLLPAHPLHLRHLVVKSGHRVERRALVKTPGIGVGGANSTGARSASPATTPHKNSSTQLTIFYDGTVNVYDVSADRVFKSQASKADFVFLFLLFEISRNPHRVDSHILKYFHLSGHWNGQAQAITNMLSGNGNARELDPDQNLGERGACTRRFGSSNNPLFWTVQTSRVPDDVPAALTMPRQTAKAECTKEIENLPVLPLARKQSLQRFLQNRQIRLHSAGPYTKSAASPSNSDGMSINSGSIKLTYGLSPLICGSSS